MLDSLRAIPHCDLVAVTSSYVLNAYEETKQVTASRTVNVRLSYKELFGTTRHGFGPCPIELQHPEAHLQERPRLRQASQSSNPSSFLQLVEHQVVPLNMATSMWLPQFLQMLLLVLLSISASFSVPVISLSPIRSPVMNQPTDAAVFPFDWLSHRNART